MSKFRQRPIVVEAEQWWPSQHVRGVLLQPGDPPMGTLHTVDEWPDSYTWVAPGDWIITDAQGRKRSCRPDVFALTYEPV